MKQFWRALACLSLVTALDAQSVRMSRPLAAGPSQAGDVLAFRADGLFAAYLADQETPGVIELHGVPLDGSASPVKLSGTLVPGGNVLDRGEPDFALAPAGGRVVYIADAEVDELFELYSAPLDGSAPPVKLNDVLSGGDVHAFRITADGTRVLYLADVSGGGSLDLFVAPIDGSAVALPLALGVASDDSLPFEASPDGLHAVYASSGRLYSVLLDGSASPVELEGPLAAGGAVEGDPPFRISSDGTRVVFRADKDTNDTFELYGVPVDGSASPLKLNGPLIAGVSVGAYQLTPDDARVLYFAKALFSVSILGGPTTNIGLAGNFVIAPDSSRVVFAQRVSGTLLGLFSRAVTGGPPAVRLDAGGNVALCTGGVTFAISPDSSRVAFLETDGELYGAPIDGSAPRVQLSAGGVRSCAAGGAFPLALPISSDGRALFFADPEADGLFELFSAPLDGSAGPVALDDAPVCGGELGAVPGVEPALAGGSSALYLADQEQDDVRELFVVPVDRSSAPRRLNGALVPSAESGDVTSFELAPGGRFAVYLADPEEDERSELFSVDTDDPRISARLSGTLARCGDVSAFAITPDGARVVFLADKDTDGVVEVYAVPIDGSAAPLRLNAPFGAGGGAAGSPFPSFAPLTITPDSSRVLYYARQSSGDPLALHCAALDGSGAVLLGEASAFRLDPAGASAVLIGPGGELFRVPCDGTGLPASLTGPLAQEAELLNVWGEPEFEVSADGLRAVFVGDLLTDGVVELFCVPLDGSAPPLRLNTNLVGGGDVRGISAGVPSFRLTPDGQRAVVSADPFFDEQFEVLTVLLDGSALWSQLNGALAQGGDVHEYALTPDGSRVVYRADELQNERVELFSRAADGTGQSVRLNDALAFNRDVVGFQLADDSIHAVFQADALVNDEFELFSVPVDASALPVRLNAPLPPAADIPTAGGFRLGPGGRLAYLADARVDERFELYAASLAHPGKAVRANDDLVAGGNVLSAPDGFAFGRSGRLFYLADQSADTVVELFAQPRRVRPSAPPH